MSLAERLQEVRAKAKPTFKQWFESLDDDDRAELIKAAADPYLPTKKLIAIVRSEGISVGEELFKEWRVSYGYPG